MKNSSKADLKESICSIIILAALMLKKLGQVYWNDLFCKQISLNLTIFGRNKDNFREKNYFLVIHLRGY